MANVIFFVKHHIHYLIGIIIAAALVVVLCLFVPFIDTPLGVIFTPAFVTCGTIPSLSTVSPVDYDTGFSIVDFSRVRCFYFANKNHRDAMLIFNVHGVDSGVSNEFITNSQGKIYLRASGGVVPRPISTQVTSVLCDPIRYTNGSILLICRGEKFIFKRAPLFGWTI